MTKTQAIPFVVGTATSLLGEIISWTCTGVSVTHMTLVSALNDAGLEENMARELAPKHAFTRACKKLSEQRIIRQVAEDESTVKFHFTSEHRSTDRIEYELETMLSLNKTTGKISCDLTGLATLAQEHLDHAIDARTGGDVTRVIQKLFERHADLFPIRPQGGCYFVPACHAGFVDRVQAMLGRINGQILRFPVPTGTSEGDRSVKDAVASGLAALIEDHRRAVAQFGEDTREDTLKRAAEKIRKTQFKIETYAAYLAEERERLEQTVTHAQHELRAKIEQIASAAVA